jgi:YD repeat-containing protein
VRTLTFDRDDAGRLTDASDPSATYAFALDDAGRVTSETQTLAALSFDIEYASTFNDNGARTQLQAILDGTNDFRNTYTRDNISRVTRIDQEDVSGGNTLAEKRIDLACNDYGNLRKIARYADIAATEFVANTFLDYDEFGRVIEIFHTMDSTAPEEGWGTDILAGYLVEWDAANRVTSIDSYIDGLSEFAYDNSDQLLDADHTSQSDEDYSFDDNGNRTMTGYTTGDNNQLTSDGRR